MIKIERILNVMLMVTTVIIITGICNISTVCYASTETPDQAFKKADEWVNSR